LRGSLRLGLFSEEYEVDRKRLVGSFRQAFTHLALVGSALQLDASVARPPREAVAAEAGR
jgi:GH15 family glucan-1,4-alpha-glucosidase